MRSDTTVKLRDQQRETQTDPTAWCFSTGGLGTTYALVAAYVDDSIIIGIAGKRFGIKIRVAQGSFALRNWNLVEPIPSSEGTTSFASLWSH